MGSNGTTRGRKYNRNLQEEIEEQKSFQHFFKIFEEEEKKGNQPIYKLPLPLNITSDKLFEWVTVSKYTYARYMVIIQKEMALLQIKN